MLATEITAESTSRFTEVNGVKVHYNEAGSPSAPTMIMLHGGGPGATGWSNFQRNIGPLSENYHVLAVDQIGFGQTDYVELPEAFATGNAKLLVGLMDELGIDKVTPVGNSMGGGTSLALAIDFPQRVDKVVLMGAAIGGPSLFVPMMTEGVKVMTRARQNPTMDTLRDLVKIMVYDSSFLTDELVAQRLEVALATHRPGAQQPTQLRDFGSQLSKVTAKTLILWGRDDRTVPLDWGLKALWGIPDSRLVVFSKCGHWAQTEHADAFNRLVADFLAHE